jgi:hypothetical protein
MVRDAVAGRDSLDVVTIGDSNAGISYGGFGGGGGGWTRGILRALNNAGAPTYGSPLMPISSQGITTTTGVVKEDDTTTVSTIAGYFSNVTAAADITNLTSGATTGPSDLSLNVIPNTSFLPYGLTNFNYAWVPATKTVQTFSQLNGTYPGGADPNPTLPSWCTWNTTLRYHYVFARTATSGGSINPTIYSVIGGNYAALATKSVSTYSSAGTAVLSDYVQFTMPASGAVIFGWAYIGIATGPAGVIYDSVYKPVKGVSVSNLHYGSGQTINTISAVISGANNGGGYFLDNYFKALVDRQVAAGGSGRILVWINGGVNGDTSAQWTAGMSSIVSAIQSAWVRAGYSLGNLAFVTSVSHALDTDYGGNTESTLQGIRADARQWVRTCPNTTLVDLPTFYTAAQATANGYFMAAGNASPLGEAHLSQTGYYEFSKKIVNAFLTSH